MERLTEGVQDYFDNYDWDKKFIEHFGEGIDTGKGNLKLWMHAELPEASALTSLELLVSSLS